MMNKVFLKKMYILDISLYICVVIKKFTQTNQNKRNGKTLFLNMFISFLMHDIGDAFGCGNQL